MILPTIESKLNLYGNAELLKLNITSFESKLNLYGNAELLKLNITSFEQFSGNYMACWVNKDMVARWYPLTNRFSVCVKTSELAILYKWFILPGYAQEVERGIKHAAHAIAEQVYANIRYSTKHECS